MILVQPVPCPKRYPAAAITDFLIPCGTRSRRRFDEEEDGRLKLACRVMPAWHSWIQNPWYRLSFAFSLCREGSLCTAKKKKKVVKLHRHGRKVGVSRDVEGMITFPPAFHLTRLVWSIFPTDNGGVPLASGEPASWWE